jgi:uncharacterized membrane protein (DUF4010 family)
VINLDLETLKQAVVAVAIGLMMGLEREYAGLEKEQDWLEAHPQRRGGDSAQRFHATIGARTFALLTFSGWVSGLFGGAALPLGFCGLSAILVALHYHHTGAKDRGITTEVAALAAPLLGLLLHQDMLLAAALSVIVTLLLLSKPWFKEWIPRLHREDLIAAVQLLIVFAVALPLLPTRAIDPWQVLSPRKIGWLVALIAGVDFAGYALNRVLGARRGAVLTGLVGGLVSSTAVTLGMSRQVRQQPSLMDPATVAVLLACAVMGLRVLGLMAVLGGADLALRLALPLGFMVLSVFTTAWWLARHPHAEKTEEVPLQNPFHLKRAVAWGAALAAVLLASTAARAWFGDRGLMLTALVSGFADVDPLTLAVSHQVRETGLAAGTAVTAVIVAIGANTFTKTAIAWVNGGRAFGIRLAGLLGIPFLIGLALTALAS